MNLEAYTNAAVAGVPLVGLVFALAYFYGLLGLSGKRQLLASFATGFVLGLGYMVITVVPPSGPAYNVFVYWFGNVIYGIGMGLVPSGVYEGIKNASGKGQIRAIKAIEEQAVRGASYPYQE